MSTPRQPNQKTQTLVKRAREGDRRAFTLLYARLAPALQTWARLRLPATAQSRIDPEDLMHEVWWRALEAFRTYDPDRASFRTYLFTIAKRVLIDVLRRAGTASGRGGPSAGPIPSASELPESVTNVSRQAARDEVLLRVAQTLRSLDDTDRNVFVHCGLEGLRPGQAATLIGLPKEMVVKRWQRLRAKLRNEVPEGEQLLVDPD